MSGGNIRHPVCCQVFPPDIRIVVDSTPDDVNKPADSSQPAKAGGQAHRFPHSPTHRFINFIFIY